jgi:hypothetical protein
MHKHSPILAAVSVLGALALSGCLGLELRPDPRAEETLTVVEPTADEEPGAAEQLAQEEPAAETGTRENPHPIGSVVSSDEWTVVINSVTLAATDDVLAANEFNEPPDEGTEYIVINYTVTYTGNDPNGQTPMFVGVEYVTGSGTTMSASDKFLVAPDPVIDVFTTLYNGGSVSGNHAIQVPSPVDGVLAVEAGMLADKAFVAVQ